MKKSSLGFISVIVIAAILSLTACGRGQSLPEPVVKLPVELSSFDVAKYDYDFDLGDYQRQVKLSKAQRAEFQMLLQPDKWFDPGELPGRDYTSVLDAVNGKGWNLTVGYWDEKNTIIALFNDDQTEKIFYFAPASVQEKVMEFRKSLK